MWRIIYSDKALSKLARMDEAMQARVRETLAIQRWHNSPAHATWLRFVSAFLSAHSRNFHVLCQANPKGFVVNVLDIVLERDRLYKGPALL